MARLGQCSPCSCWGLFSAEPRRQRTGMSSSSALIFLHGSGDTGEGVQAWLHAVSGGAFEASLAREGISMLFPTATMIPYSLIGGMPRTVWFDRVAMAYEAPEDVAGLKRSVELVDKEIDKLVESGIPLSKIGVGGMSMGGCVALHVAYGMGRHAGRLGMVASLSTFLPKESYFDADASRRLTASQTAPLFMAHGQDDGMIRIEWARATHSRLLAAGIDCKELLEFPGVQHELCTEEVGLLRSFVLQHLGKGS
ncbi:LYPLAL1 [Symbiodinium pilosum]|uniref:LYPLAL1 protein n=1 Tax=Symbiodinium pilosum TaxID=2952 RepID=A0A812WYN6_SYMPI|nr:LYPLAL1 [Symbiodinium pilosum]